MKDIVPDLGEHRDDASPARPAVGAVDVWAQVVTERMARRPWFAPLMRWTGRAPDQIFDERVLTETIETYFGSVHSSS